jgi:prevent-host-death family protein
VAVTAGIRELRENLRSYLDRVKGGEEVIVTERGEPVARLVPASDDALYEQLVREGKVTPARRSKNSIPLPEPIPVEGSVSEFVIAERERRRG